MERNPQEAMIQKVILTGVVFTALGAVLYENGKEIDAHGEYDIVSMDSTNTVLEQDGRTYTIHTENLPHEIKDKLISTRPDLESFLKNGPINIVK
jgi:hypothetical protein